MPAITTIDDSRAAAPGERPQIREWRVSFLGYCRHTGMRADWSCVCHAATWREAVNQGHQAAGSHLISPRLRGYQEQPTEKPNV